MSEISFKRHRFPLDVIRYAVEIVRSWADKFGPTIAANIRKVRGHADSVWRLDEMVVSFNGKRLYMWRAVDKADGSNRGIRFAQNG